VSVTAPAGTRPVARRRAGTVARRVLQAGLAVVFAGAGLAELGGSPDMVALFADIGAGAPTLGLLGAAGVVAWVRRGEVRALLRR